MYTRQTHTKLGKGYKKQGNLFLEKSSLKLDDAKSLKASIALILGNASITDQKLVKLISESGMKFYKEFTETAAGLTTKPMIQFFEGCKRRAKKLTELDQLIQSAELVNWEEYGVFRKTLDGDYSPFKGKWENRLSITYFEDDEIKDLFVFKIDPKCYKPLILGYYLAISYLAEQRQYDDLREEADNTLRIVSSIFVSLGSLYTIMRSNYEHACNCMDAMIEKVETPFILDDSRQIYVVRYDRFQNGLQTDIQPDSALNDTKTPIRVSQVNPSLIARNMPDKCDFTQLRIIDLFNVVKNDILKAVSIMKEAKMKLPNVRKEWLKENYPRNLRYVYSISNAISAVDTKRKYDPSKDDHISMKSSGTSYNGRTLPALYASLVEVDVDKEKSKEFDNLIGYESEYRLDTDKIVVQRVSAAKLVEPPAKIDGRPIFILDNPHQDRFNYLHNIIQEILDLMPEDCTSKQFEAVKALLQWTNPIYREKYSNAVYTLDISDATNTCSLEFNRMVLSILFDEPICSWWYDTMKIETKAYYPSQDKEFATFHRQRGQSQGAKSSFPAFALMHHIIYLMSIKVAGWDRCYTRNIYRIIGDDSGSSTQESDRDYSFRNFYIQICDWMGWIVNPQKGYSAPANSNIAFAEMAKVRILNGRINTPIPPRLLIKGGKDLLDIIALSSWFSKNYLDSQLDIDVVINNSKLSKRNENYLTWLRKLIKVSPSRAFEGLQSSVEVSEKEEALILMLYIEEKLESTLVSQILPEHALTDESRFQRYYSKFGLYKSIENFYLSGEFWNNQFVQNSTSTKYVRLYNKNEDLIHAIESDIGVKHYVAEAVTSLRLSRKERNDLVSLLDTFNCFKENGEFPLSSDNLRKLSDEVFESLGRYNDRSDVRRALSEGFFADSIIERIIQNESYLEKISIV